MIEPSTVVEHRTQEGLGVRPVRPDIDVDRVAAAIQPRVQGTGLHPASHVREKAILVMPFDFGSSRYLMTALSSVWYLTQLGELGLSAPAYWLKINTISGFGAQRISKPKSMGSP